MWRQTTDTSSSLPNMTSHLAICCLALMGGIHHGDGSSAIVSVALCHWCDILNSSARPGILTLVTGYLCLIAQLVLYVWCIETTGIKTAVLIIAVIAVLPLLSLFPLPIVRHMQAPYHSKGKEADKAPFEMENSASQHGIV